MVEGRKSEGLKVGISTTLDDRRDLKVDISTHFDRLSASRSMTTGVEGLKVERFLKICRKIR
jgi:hypothetical protein